VNAVAAAGAVAFVVAVLRFVFPALLFVVVLIAAEIHMLELVGPSHN
jgi:hypothetical protein